MPDKELTDERFEKLANKTLRFAGTQIFYCFVCKRKLSHPRKFASNYRRFAGFSQMEQAHE